MSMSGLDDRVPRPIGRNSGGLMNPCAECVQLEDRALEAVLQFVSLVQKATAAVETSRTVQRKIEAARIRRAEASVALWRHSREHSGTALRLVTNAVTSDLN